jgi:hypothetical protein
MEGKNNRSCQKGTPTQKYARRTSPGCDSHDFRDKIEASNAILRMNEHFRRFAKLLAVEEIHLHKYST